MSYLVTSADRVAFARCGRQWDLSARGRRHLVPLAPRGAGGPDLGRAVREALDIYYFPGMWDWPRQITLPLVRQGLDRALAGQRDQHPDAADEQAWPHRLAEGRDLLERYFAWAPAVDRFSPVQVGPEYDVMVLDPDHPGHGLLTPAGQPVRYRGRIGMLAVDASDAYWIVRHRVVDGDWPPTEAGRDLAAAAAAMTAVGASTRPNPSSVRCPPCAYLAPCQAMRAGRDQEEASLLASAYTEREPEALAEGRIGATTWGMGRGAAPPRFPGRR